MYTGESPHTPHVNIVHKHTLRLCSLIISSCRNLAARNVLIGDDNKAKVSNFRLTRNVILSTELSKLLLRTSSILKR